MRRAATIAVVLAAFATAVPAGATQLTDSPYGREDNALGTLRWLPKNAIEKPAANQFRLVVVYDYSLDADGKPTAPLKTKGTFGVKFFTTSQADLTMKGRSAKVGDLKTLTNQPGLPAQADETVAGVYGDVRDGACSKAGTAAFSSAYSTTRQFFHQGTSPYAPVSGPGICEVVDVSTEIKDSNGNTLGFDTRVTNHVPGFYIDVAWPKRTIPGGLGIGDSHFLAEVWYGAAYDANGDGTTFPNGVDASSSSKSVGSPGDYTATYAFTANPGAIGAPCPGTPGVTPAPAGTWQDVKVVVPEGAKKVTFLLWPKSDWDLQVEDPTGRVTTSGFFNGFTEQEVVPSSGTGNIPDLVAGEFTMRACNWAGEPTVPGAVIIDF